ncbi:hypothetical protein D7Y09_15775 [bacterium 1XD42-1]|nr:hypothetical protein D7Y09_15775 [bacterium 1XD42-1]
MVEFKEKAIIKKQWGITVEHARRSLTYDVARPKMKTILREWKIRSLHLPDAIQKALSCFSPLGCSH